MRFMLQDKESLIHRLEFKLDREINDKGGKVGNGINNTFDNSKVVGNESISPVKDQSRGRSIEPQPSHISRANKENSSPADIRRMNQPSYQKPEPQSDNRASDPLGVSMKSQQNPFGPVANGNSFKSPAPANNLNTSTQDAGANDLTVSQKAAAKVRNGLSDLKGKLAEMKQKKEQAEAEMLKELEEYNK